MLLTALIPPSGEKDAQPPAMAAISTDASSARRARTYGGTVAEWMMRADHDDRVIASKPSHESLLTKAFW
jgi:hypothetical protein